VKSNYVVIGWIIQDKEAGLLRTGRGYGSKTTKLYTSEAKATSVMNTKKKKGNLKDSFYVSPVYVKED
jgi:hypothetical protein